jgi:hypothetical protein
MTDDLIVEAEHDLTEAERRYSELEQKKRNTDPLTKARAEVDDARDPLDKLRAAKEREAVLTEEKIRAEALKAAVADFRELAAYWDELGTDILKGSIALREGAEAMRAAGAATPSASQIHMLWRGLAGILQQTIWKSEFPVLPPDQRKPISHYVNVWSDAIEQQADTVLQAIEREQQLVVSMNTKSSKIRGGINDTRSTTAATSDQTTSRRNFRAFHRRPTSIRGSSFAKLTVLTPARALTATIRAGSTSVTLIRQRFPISARRSAGCSVLKVGTFALLRPIAISRFKNWPGICLKRLALSAALTMAAASTREMRIPWT